MSQQVLVEGVAEGKPFAANYAATGWTVDDRGFLHIFSTDGPNRTIATYAPAYWSLVSRKVIDGGQDEREGQANVR